MRIGLTLIIKTKRKYILNRATQEVLVNCTVQLISWKQRNAKIDHLVTLSILCLFEVCHIHRLVWAWRIIERSSFNLQIHYPLMRKLSCLLKVTPTADALPNEPGDSGLFWSKFCNQSFNFHLLQALFHVQTIIICVDGAGVRNMIERL